MKHFFVFFLVAMLCMACSKSGMDVNSGNGWTNISDDHGQIVLGDKLDDPYTVENMTEALEELYPTKAGRTVLEPTDLYVRFLPSSRKQYEYLDSIGVDMLDHPMDYEIVREGDYYHDPSIDDQEFTWQYAVVSTDFKFPEDIRYELLDRCYIAEHAATKSGDIDWEAVERQAFLNTGNADMLSAAVRSGDSGLVPSGRITIVDNEYNEGNPVGVSGVMVACNIFVKVDICYTDKDGYYQMHRSFSGDPRYRLIFKNEKGFALGFNFVIIPGSISTLGKDSPAGTSVQITRESDRALFCRSAVNNTVCEYYEACEKEGSDINMPPSNLRIWLFYLLGISSSPMFQQGVWIDNSILSEFFGEYMWIVKMFLPDVTLAMRDCYTYKDVYCTTMHQLAHTSHYCKVGNGYWETLVLFVLKCFLSSGGVAYGSGSEENCGYCEVAEMWSYYCETFFRRRRYGADEPSSGTNFWFHPQIFLNLDARGLGRLKIFKALCDDVYDQIALHDRLVALYPECRAEITQAFGRYE